MTGQGVLATLLVGACVALVVVFGLMVWNERQRLRAERARMAERLTGRQQVREEARIAATALLGGAPVDRHTRRVAVRGIVRRASGRAR